MYKAYDDPWGQKESYSSDISTRIYFALLQQLHLQVKPTNQSYGKSPDDQSAEFSILDIGCAQGYHSKLFRQWKPRSIYVGTDISKTVIEQAAFMHGANKTIFETDDCRVRNNAYQDGFDLVFSSKTLYYVGPEIDRVIGNISTYLVKGGYFSFIYNQRDDSFSNQWLTYEKLRKILRGNKFEEVSFTIAKLNAEEDVAIGFYQRLF